MPDLTRAEVEQIKHELETTSVYFMRVSSIPTQNSYIYGYNSQRISQLCNSWLSLERRVRELEAAGQAFLETQG